MKILTVLGTRPEIIRLSRIIPALDQLCEHIVVHTGQNFDANLNNIFFSDLMLRDPDFYLNAKGTLGEQIGQILAGVDNILQIHKPDKFLVLGDTNSALSAIIAKRLGIPVFHMEAGNRCYDDRVPEEVNRRVIDHSSDILMPYTERSRQNLLREGIASERIFVTGNPIFEVITHFESQIQKSDVLNRMGIEQGKYFLVTLHRAENVDIEKRLRQFCSAFEQIVEKYHLPIVVSTHPRTRIRMQGFGISLESRDIKFMEPFGFFDFITLERNACCVLSDSGTVQEECSIFHIPNITLRDVTERPETIECGSNILSGSETKDILKCIELVLSQPPSWDPPTEYMVRNVSKTAIKILTGFQMP